MRNEGPPRSLGYVAHRTIVPMSEVNFDVDTDNVVMWSGDGFHIVHYPLRDHTLFNVVTVFKTLDMAPTDTDSPHPDLARVYRDSHPTMKKLWGMMDLSRRGWVSGDRDPIRHWSKGRVTLLGDAAHPTLQSLAQGACMAIEDAVCLAELLDGTVRQSGRGGVHPLRQRALSAHRAGAIRIALLLGQLVPRRRARTRSRCARPGSARASRTCSTASPGSMTGSSFPRKHDAEKCEAVFG